MGEKILMAIDTGYSHVKMAAYLGENFLFQKFFPSIVQEYVEDGIVQGASKYILTWAGSKYIVGNSKEGGQVYITDDFHGSINWQALLCRSFFEVCRKLNTKELHISILGLGLPYTQYNIKMQTRISQHKHFTFKVDNDTYEVTIDKIAVLPQGAALLSDYSDAHDVGIIDIGHHTIDLALMKDSELITSKSTSTHDGVSTVFHSLDRLLNEKIGKSSLDFRKQYEILTKKKFLYNKKEINLEQEINGILSKYAKKIEMIAKDKWRDDFEFLDYILVAGGGAELLQGFLPDKFTIVEHAFFGNALGYLKYIKHLE